MKQYEYLQYEGNAHDPEIVGKLNDFGAKGWEMVNVVLFAKIERVMENLYHVLYIFKREITTTKQLLNEEKIHE